jgi:hypothetical protein
MRYLTPHLQTDLKKKMVLLAGARQCGQYFNWDITKDRKVIRELAWPKNASLVVLGELHKAPKWKDLLKSIADQFGNKPPILVTGSACDVPGLFRPT